MCNKSKRMKKSVVLIVMILSIGSLVEGNEGEILPVISPADLDLSGDIVYAINFGNNGNPQFGDFVFSQDQDYPAVSLSASNEEVVPPSYGVSPDTGYPNLDMLINGVAWTNDGPGRCITSISAGGLNVGTSYQLQLVFYEARTGENRLLEVILDGETVVKEHDIFRHQGSVVGKGASVLKYTFSAKEEILDIDIIPNRNDGGHLSSISGLIVTEFSSLATRSQARKPNPADGALHEDTWVGLGWTPGVHAASHDVYFGENSDDVNNGTDETFQGNQATMSFILGFPGFPYPDGLVPGTTYYWRIDEVNDTEPNNPWKGPVWSFTVPPKTAYHPIPTDGAEFVDLNVELSWTGGFGAKPHTVYFGDNFDDVSNAAGGLPQGSATYNPGPLELEKIYYWRVDEFDAIDTYKGDVWSFTTPGTVGSLNPANGATDAKQTLILEWIAADSATSHELYFGTDKDAVRNADTSSPEYKGGMNLGSESYDVGKLEWDSTYYWRVDEVKADTTVQKGLIWSFTTANFLIVDDFESYNDLDPSDSESNRIFGVWSDGFDDPANGSVVGYTNSPFAEQTIVHSGMQSMPLTYDNSVGYSEATMTLTYPRDWTQNSIGILTIWFKGDSANAAEPMYVTLNGSAVVSNENPVAAQISTWTQWNIDLQAFAGQDVDLANVNTISLGFGDKNNPQPGGSGSVYFDDIRLYRPVNVLGE